MKKRWIPLNWIQWVTIINVIVLAVTIPIIVARLSAASQAQTQALRTVICFFEQRVKATQQLSAKQKHDAIRLYTEALASIHSQPCP